MIQGKDGTWVGATKVTRLECSCGTVEVSRWPLNDRDEQEFVEKHLREKHGGVAR